MSKKKLILTLIVLSAAYLAVTFALQPKLHSVLRVETTPTPTAGKPAGSDTTLSYKCHPSRNALALLKEATKNVETKDYSFGKLVTQINGLKNGTGGDYWTYSVDGKSATISADNYKCLGNEKIEWQFGKAE